jgi:hypothetical protein
VTARARLLGALVAASLAGSVAREARAAGPGDKAACVQSYEEAQRLRKASRFAASRAQLLACQATCPPALRADCDGWIADTDRRSSSIVVSAQTERGATTAVRVYVDGALVAARLDGGPLAVDPGERALRFEADGHAPVAMRLVLVEGEKGRPVAVRFDAPAVNSALAPTGVPETPASPLLAAPAPTGSAPRRATLPVLVAAGVAGVGLVGVVVFAIERGSAIGSLDRCRPNCPVSDVATANHWLGWMYGSLALAAVGGGAAAYLYFAHPLDRAPRAGAPRGFAAIVPELGGARAIVGTTF